jgi:hypothetical protein
MAQSEVDEGIDAVEEQRLRAIDRALAKIDEGTYGLSDVSGDPIPRARLEAMPEAVLTVQEEEARELCASVQDGSQRVEPRRLNEPQGIRVVVIKRLVAAFDVEAPTRAVIPTLETKSNRSWSGSRPVRGGASTLTSISSRHIQRHRPHRTRPLIQT